MLATELAKKTEEKNEEIKQYMSMGLEAKKNKVTVALINLDLNNQHLSDKVNDSAFWDDWLRVIDQSLKLYNSGTGMGELLDSFMMFSELDLGSNIDVDAEKVPFLVENIDLSQECIEYKTREETTVVVLRCSDRLVRTKKLVINKNVLAIKFSDDTNGYCSGCNLDLVILSEHIRAYDIYNVYERAVLNTIEFNVGDLSYFNGSIITSEFKILKGRNSEFFMEILERNGLGVNGDSSLEVVTSASDNEIIIGRNTKSVKIAEPYISNRVIVHKLLDDSFNGKQIESLIVSLEGKQNDCVESMVTNCSIKEVILSSNIINGPVFSGCEIDRLVIAQSCNKLSNVFNNCTFGSITGDTNLSAIGKGAFKECQYYSMASFYDKMNIVNVKELSSGAFEDSTGLLSLSGRLKYNVIDQSSKSGGD